MSLKESLNGYLRLPRAFFGIPQRKEIVPDLGILGIPYDITSSYIGGSRLGPDAIRKATDSERSHSYPLQLPNHDIPTETKDTPLAETLTIEDIGDLEVGTQLPESVSFHISEATAILSKHNINLLFLGGDHFITYPILKGIRKTCKSEIGLIYFDSHADFYQEMGGAPLSHATTLRRIIDQDLVRLENVIAHDVRCAPPEQYAELKNVGYSSVNDFAKAVSELSTRVDSMYISIDLDVLAPEIMSGVSHPESGGLALMDFLSFLRPIFTHKKVRYVDIVEFNPLLDSTQTSSITVRDLVKEVLTGFACQKNDL